LRQLQEHQAEAREYEAVSLVQVQGWSEIERGQSLFESIIVFENYPETKAAPDKNAQLGIASVSFFELTNYPLTIVVGPAEELSLIFVYDESRFDAATIRRMLEHFEALLEKMTDGATQKLIELPLLSDTEKQLLLSEWNAIGPEVSYPPLHEIFEEQVSKNAAALAISFRGEKLTYGELNEQSNQLAHALRSLGSEADGKVAVMLDTGSRQITALLGVLKAGCTFICLDPNYPRSRLKQILEEVRPAIVITDSTCFEWHRSLLDQCRDDFSSAILSIDEINLNSYPKSNPDITVSPEAAAYIVFTSGSTGRPKGIVQSHRSFAQFLEWQNKYFDFGENKRIAQWASITYDASYCEIFGALCSGSTLCLETVAVRHDPQVLAKWLREERISVLIVVPSFGRQVLQAIEAAELELPHLEAVGLAGEVVPVDMAIAWRQRFPNRPRLVNLYGPTECVLATYYEVENIAALKRSVPVGRAIDGRQILILDREQRLCPIGVKGEIYICSPYLAQGYFQNELETRSAFIQNPLFEDGSDRVYRTGDLGRWLPDGNLQFFGRIDNQVKVRGVRVELEEIESALRRHESVKECVVAVQSFADGDQRVVAYVVGTEDVPATTLRSFLQNWLPQSMLPANFVFLDRIPRTPNGKIDRKALTAASDQWQPEAEVDFVAPQTELESTVAEIWRDVLRVERVGVNDNFFALGGHSLLATQLVNRVRTTCSVNLPLRSVFEAPSVSGMATLIERLQNEAQSQTGRVADIINEINFLSDDEVEALLNQKKIVPASTSTTRIVNPEISGD
jgi:amino acid adenylation domain-containing protein